MGGVIRPRAGFAAIALCPVTACQPAYRLDLEVTNDSPANVVVEVDGSVIVQDT